MATRPFIVLKLGGSTVSTRQSWETIAEIARSRLDDGLRPLLVCSAMSGVPEAIEQLTEAAVRGGHGETLQELRTGHRAHARDLGVDEGLSDEAAGELERLAHGSSLVQEASPRLRARALALGELLSARLGAAFLDAAGLETALVDARELLLALPEPHVPESRHYLDAICDDAVDPALVRRLAALEADVIVTQGAVGRNERGETVLLGRGGSDTSAAYFAAKLSARRCELWTDVAGIYTTDPRDIPSARLLQSLDYDEAQEIASCGAKVLNPRCIGPCRRNGIRLSTHCIEDPELRGTVITATADADASHVKALCKRTGVVLVSMDTLGMWQQVGFLADVFAVFKDHGVSVDLVSTSEANVTASLDAAATGLDRAAIDALVRDLRKRCATSVIGPWAAISLVGKGIRTILHQLGPALRAFEEQRIHLVAQAASDLNLTFVVDEAEADRLVARLHAMLFADSRLGPTWREAFGSQAGDQAASGPAPWWLGKREALLDQASSGTPVYVYDEESLAEAAEELLALKAVDRVFYSVKANPHPAVLGVFHEAGLGFECVSCGEIAHLRGLLPDLDPERTLFTPNFAPRGEYEEAFDLDVHVTVDSLHALSEWPAIFKGREILVRLDPGRGRGHHPHVRTAGAQSKFGISPEDWDRLVALVDAAEARVRGLHAHAGSGIQEPGAWGETALFLAEMADKLDAAEWIDVGGGLGVPDKPGQPPLDLEALNASLAQALAASPGRQLWIEPGRYLVARAGVLLATVTQVKQKGEVRYVGVDAGMNSLIRPALYGAYHEIVNLSRLDQPASETAHVVGPICETGDTLGHARRIAPAQEGDVLLVATAGAYGHSMSSSYNLREPAREGWLPWKGR